MSAALQKPSAKETVKTHWGVNAPVWVRQLAAQCDVSSQKKTADKIGRSAALVNQVLKNRYAGDLRGVQERVETAFGDKVTCPVLGQIDGGECLRHQQAKYNPGNHAAVSLFVACKKCPHNLICKGAKP